MDRSFLAQARVISASRPFVCVRLSSYEDKSEADFLKTVYVGRSGQVENTVFTILAPDGKQKLIHAARSPRRIFSSAYQMAQTMNRIAGKYQGRKAKPDGDLPLPKTATVKLALNLASCDNQPLALLFAKDAATLQKLEKEMSQLAWTNAHLGKFVYAATQTPQELAAIEGVPPAGGLLVVQPDKFGLQGKVIAQARTDSTAGELSKTLYTGVGKFQRRQKTFHNHVRAGHMNRIFWETKIPVTDPMERRARERLR